MIKDIIIRAYNFSENKHVGVVRKFSGLPYFTHPKAVARLLEELNCDVDIVAAGFLHDTLEDTNTTYEELLEEFGERIAKMVRGVSNDPVAMKEAGGKRFYLARKISEELTEDELTLKLADRYHNVLFLEHDSTPKEFIVKYYKETKFILFVLGESDRQLNEVQLALAKRIDAVLEFLRIRYKM